MDDAQLDQFIGEYLEQAPNAKESHVWSRFEAPLRARFRDAWLRMTNARDRAKAAGSFPRLAESEAEA